MLPNKNSLLYPYLKLLVRLFCTYSHFSIFIAQKLALLKKNTYPFLNFDQNMSLHVLNAVSPMTPEFVVIGPICILRLFIGPYSAQVQSEQGGGAIHCKVWKLKLKIDSHFCLTVPPILAIPSSVRML